MFKHPSLWMMLITVAVLFIIFIFPHDVKGNESKPIILDASTEKQDLYPAIDMVKDRTRQLTINDIRSEPFSGQFIPTDEVKQQVGFFETATWIRFEVDNQAEQKEWLLEFAFPLIHDIRIYALENSGMVELYKGGADFPFEQKEFNHRHFVFPLEIEPNASKTYYAVAAGSGDLHPPIYIWDPEAFNKKTQMEYALLGLFYGVIFVMIFYNLFLYVSLRLKSYLYYVLVISCTLLGKLSINGFGYQYLWPHAPKWNVVSAPFWVGLGFIFVLFFTRHFLDVDRYIPSFKKLFYILMPLNAMVIATLPLSHYIAHYLMVLGALGTSVSVLAVAIICLKRGARQARFYIVGWFIFLTGVSITILERAVILPYSVVTEYAGQAALTMEVVLLSLALADKINLMRKEKELAETRAQESQALAIQNLEKADALKDEFLAVTSHELRTPLYGMIGIAESLRDGIVGDVSAEMKEQLAMIVTSGHRLTHLVNDILDFSKLEHDSLALHLKPVYIKGVADVVLTVSKPLLKHKPIRLIQKIDASLPPVRADENRLQQILYNLLGNAMKYTTEGEIVISATAVGDELIISISDTGQGIAEDQLSMIFQPFQQGDASLAREVGGSGIGLSITKRLVDLHGGKLDVESKVGEGSTFHVTLPVHDDMRHVEQAAVTAEPFLLEEPELRQATPFVMESKSKILIADDEAVNLQVLMNQLVLEGYEVLPVSRGEEVFHVLDEHDIDLLILDIMMPTMSGYEVCRRLRETYSLMDLPILMLTAKNQPHDKIVSFDVGANDYLVKPCDKQELLSRVKTLVRVKTLNQEIIEMNQHLEEKIHERTQALEVANDDLQHMNDELLAMEASRRQLLANIAHELGTPVTLLHSYLQSLQEGLIAADDRHYRQLVFDKINVLNRLIDDLFDLSRLEAGQASLTIEPIRLADWLERVYHKCAFAVSQGNRRFKHGTMPAEFERLFCFIDVERMDQVFSNLISNAIKHTSEKTGQIAIEATVEEEESLIIQVRDNGFGIDEADMPFIFDRFYKEPLSEMKGKQDGTGLGLAIVKQIVQSHKGDIWVESNVNEGTIFTITLPVNLVMPSTFQK